MNDQLPDSLVIRLSKVCANYPHPKNLLTDWLNSCNAGNAIKCIEDQRFCPTSVDDIAQGILSLIQLNSNGIYHLSASPWSRLSLANLFTKTLGSDTKIIEQALERFQLVGLRPINTTLNNAKFLNTCGGKFETMQSTIQTYCENIAPHPSTTAT